MHLARIIVLVAAGGLFCSCQSVVQSARQWAKARPAAVSPFIEHRGELRRNPPAQAFHYEWSNPDLRLYQRAVPVRQLYVAPVTLRYLRPSRASVARWDRSRKLATAPEAPEMARRLRDEVIHAFQRSPHPRFRVVSHPSRETLTLTLALVELTPTHVGGNATKFGAKLLMGPIATLAGLAAATGGTIAIEGRVTLSATGQALYEFADQEQDKLTFYSLRDLVPYGHAVIAVEEWAQQIEMVSRTAPGQRIEDSTFWTLSPL